MSMYMNSNNKLVVLAVSEVKEIDSTRIRLEGTYSEWDKDLRSNVEKTVSILYTDFPEDNKPKYASRVRKLKVSAGSKLVTPICEKDGKFYGGKIHYASNNGIYKFKTNKNTDGQIVFGRLNKVEAHDNRTNVSIPVDVYNADGSKNEVPTWYNIAFWDSDDANGAKMATRASKVLKPGDIAIIRINMGKDREYKGKTYTNYIGYSFEIITKAQDNKTTENSSVPTEAEIVPKNDSDTQTTMGGITVDDEYGVDDFEEII